MHTSFNRVNGFDDSPFQYARMTYLRGRVDENLGKYVALRQQVAGRLNSHHILVKLLYTLTTEFKGDLLSYIDRVTSDCERICGTLGITSSYSRGRLHKEGHFYPGCPEIITFVRSEKWNWMDLWNNWHDVPAIEVYEHPVSDLTIWEPSVMNDAELSHPGLAVVNIDIPLLACQWRMWKAANPFDNNETFITTVLLPGMLRSHLDQVMFNKMLVKFELKEPCTVRSNLVFAQTPTNTHADEIIDDAYGKILGRKMAANQILSSIPTFYYGNALDSGSFPASSPTHQILWAILTQKESRAALVLRVGKMVGIDRLVGTIARLHRTAIRAQQDQYFSAGQSTADAEFLEGRFKKFVLDNLPPA